MSEENLNELIKKLDTDKTGYIGYTEFLTAAIDKTILMNDMGLEQAFGFFDINQSGTIEKNEIIEAMNKGWISKEQLKDLFNAIDSNKDEKVSVL